MTGIQTPIGGWHRDPALGTEVTDARKMSEAPTMHTAEYPALGEAIRVVPTPAKNPMPVLRSRDQDNHEIVVHPPHFHDGQTNIPRWIDMNGGMLVLFWLLAATIVLSPIAFVVAAVHDNKTEAEFLRQIGWKKTGPYTVIPGVYEWKNGKATRLGLNHPGDTL